MTSDESNSNTVLSSFEEWHVQFNVEGTKTILLVRYEQSIEFERLAINSLDLTLRRHPSDIKREAWIRVAAKVP
jgi:hypothetical protein